MCQLGSAVRVQTPHHKERVPLSPCVVFTGATSPPSSLSGYVECARSLTSQSSKVVQCISVGHSQCVGRKACSSTPPSIRGGRLPRHLCNSSRRSVLNYAARSRAPQSGGSSKIIPTSETPLFQKPSVTP